MRYIICGGRNTLISKTINYIWLDPNDSQDKEYVRMPKFYQLSIISARVSNPDYRIRIWTTKPLMFSKDDYLYYEYYHTDNINNHIIIPKWIESINEIGIEKFPHKADYIRYKILYLFGGIYSDTDIILMKSLDNLLNNKIVVAYQSKVQICNGFIMCEPITNVIEYVLDKYRTDYQPNKWAYNSMRVLQKELKSIDDIGIKFLKYEEGFHYPNFRYIEEVMRDGIMSSGISPYAHHLFNSSPGGRKVRERIESIIDGSLYDGEEWYIDNLISTLINVYKEEYIK